MKQVRIENLESRRHFIAAPGDVIASISDPGSAHTYHLLASTTWDDAEAKSVGLGGHLVVINDQAEQDLIWNTFKPQAEIIWIGFTDRDHEGRYAWVTGEPAVYTNWFANEPNNLYPSGEHWGNMWSRYNGQWNDLGADSPEGKNQFAVAEVRNGPDLFATLGDAPMALDPGGAFDVSGSVKNIGSAAASGAVRVAYYLSTDATLDGADRLIASVATPAGDLPFNATTPISTNLTIPADVTAGTYRLLARVDADDALPETDEANNVAVSRAFDVGAVSEPVIRTVRGIVRDGNDLPLNGVEVRVGESLAYTDYDGRKKSLDRDGITGDFELDRAIVGHNVSFGGVFSRFVAAEGANFNFIVTAGDVAGSTFANEVSIDEILALDDTMLDGGLKGAKTPVALQPIFLASYSVAAGNDAISVHRDLRNDRNSHLISTKPQKAVAASARYRRSVELLTDRLAVLGLRESAQVPLATVAELKKNSAAERALKLAKEIWFGAGPGRKVLATVDGPTLAALNASDPSSPLWTAVLPPKWTAAPGLVDGYVSRGAFAKMRQLADQSSAAEFVLTRGSPAAGGTGKTFRAGGEIEFRWFYSAGVPQITQPFWEPIEDFTRRDVTLLGGKKLAIPSPSEFGVSWKYVAGYDQGKTREAISALLSAGVTRVHFNDPAILQELGAVSISAGARPTLTVLRTDLGPAAGCDAVVHATI